MTRAIILTSEITVKPIQSMGGDHMVVAAAKVSTCGEAALKFADPVESENNFGLIDYLMKHRHGSPFEHSAMTFFVHAPAFVWWEWVRHRIGFSYNLESGRYSVLDPVFWIPKRGRKMRPSNTHKSARPDFVSVEGWQYNDLVNKFRESYEAAWKTYSYLTAGGAYANEVARSVLGFGVYYSGWVTCNPRSLMSFLSLRTHDETAKYVSYPQAEIEEAARTCETILAEGWPLTYRSFVKNGRVAP